MECHRIIREICDLQLDLIAKVGTAKKQYQVPPDDGLYDRLRGRSYDELRAAKQTTGKHARAEAVSALKDKIKAEFIPDPTAAGALSGDKFSNIWHKMEEHVVRDLILAGTRSDGRDTKTIRPIECFVDVLPRVHGSAVFQRGETQALITVTLGTGRDEQRVDGLIDEYSKKFMLDYNFPSFSVGEVRPIRGPGRREIGHGALAERSVKPILPDPDGSCTLSAATGGSATAEVACVGEARCHGHLGPSKRTYGALDKEEEQCTRLQRVHW